MPDAQEPPEPLVSDAFEDLIKGLGNSGSANFRGIIRAGSEYERLYEHDWLARRIVQIMPDDAARKRPELDGVADPDPIWAASDDLNRSLLYPHGYLLQGLYQGRALGGSVILLGYRQGEPTDPAPESGDLAWLDVVPWADLGVERYVTDLNRPDYGLPEIVKVGGTHPRQGLRISLSRTIPCEGLPRARWERGDPTPWVSVLQPVYEVLRDYGLSWEAASLLLQESSVGVLKMSGLIGMINAKRSDVVSQRMRFVSTARSTARTVFLDADGKEDFRRTEATFTGVDKILEQLQMRVCGAAHVPHTRLFGRSPDGMSATGESDLAWFYDEVDTFRQTSLRPKLERLLSIVAKQQIKLKFPPLREATPAEAAQIRKLQAEGDEKYYDLGVVTAADLARSRTADSTLGVEVDLSRFDGQATTPAET